MWSNVVLCESSLSCVFGVVVYETRQGPIWCLFLKTSARTVFRENILQLLYEEYTFFIPSWQYSISYAVGSCIFQSMVQSHACRNAWWLAYGWCHLALFPRWSDAAKKNFSWKPKLQLQNPQQILIWSVQVFCLHVSLRTKGVQGLYLPSTGTNGG